MILQSGISDDGKYKKCLIITDKSNITLFGIRTGIFLWEAEEVLRSYDWELVSRRNKRCVYGSGAGHQLILDFDTSDRITRIEWYSA